jgi:ubiquinone/menaquinone biosynthesis C-methylase UbiE
MQLATGRAVLLFAVAASCCTAQVAEKANEDYDTAAMRQKAAFEMDHWVRPSVEHSGALIASLGLRPGAVVADIGTGVGYLLSYLAAAVGPQGAVIGEDIYSDFLSKAQEKIKARGWTNVRTVLGTEYNPNLPPAQLDVALVVDTYHHLNYPVLMLKNIRRALNPHGRLIIVDYYRTRQHPGTSMDDLREHIRLDRDEVVAEVSAQGFHLVRSFDHLPHEYVLMFGKKPTAAAARKP